MSNDYRNTEYCPVLKNIYENKENLEKKIHKDWPQTKVFYNKVKDRDGDYIDEFRRLYNHKCAYCGTSNENISVNQFEVDHYIYQKSFKSTALAGKVSNLVYSCYDCNRGKSSFLINDKYITKLNPDNGNIAKLFYRDEEFGIKIEEEYEEDITINEFYKKLKLDFEVRRLDYLLLSIRGLQNKIRNNPESNDLCDIINKLQSKRNLY